MVAVGAGITIQPQRLHERAEAVEREIRQVAGFYIGSDAEELSLKRHGPALQLFLYNLAKQRVGENMTKIAQLLGFASNRKPVYALRRKAIAAESVPTQSGAKLAGSVRRGRTTRTQRGGK